MYWSEPLGDFSVVVQLYSRCAVLCHAIDSRFRSHDSSPLLSVAREKLIALTAPFIPRDPDDKIS